MELRQLKYLLEIVKRKGFTKASETLGIAQSALSIAVKNLEHETGVTLIDRNYRKLTLTSEGEIFIKRAEGIIGQVSALNHEMEELKGLIQGAFRIGIPGMLATHFFPEIISEFKDRFPKLKISVVSDGAKKLEEMLCGGLLDVAILGEKNISPELSWKQLLKDEMVACVAPLHHLSSREHITIQELAEEPLFLFQEGNYQRSIVAELFTYIDKQPNITFETNLTSLLKIMTEKGGGVCTLLRMAVDTPGLIPISLQPPIEISTVIAWRTKSYMPLATKAFIDFINQEDYASAACS